MTTATRAADSVVNPAAFDKVFRRHRGPVTCAVGIPHSTRVATSGYDSAIATFDVKSGEVRLLGYHDHLANRITVSATGHWAASASSDYTIRIWDLEKNRLHRVLRGHADDVEDFVFLDDDRGASVSRDWRIIVWDIPTGGITRIIEGHERDVLSVNYCDGRLYTSGDDMTLRVWDVDTGRELRKWGPFDTESDTCAIDPHHDRAVLGCDDGVIRVFDIVTGRTLAEIEAHASGIKKVAVSPRNGDIMSAAYDQRILVWDANDFRQKVSLERKPAVWERSFNWSPDGSQIFAGTFDGTVLQWDAATGKFLLEIGDLDTVTGNACLNEVSGSASGDIALVSDDGYIRLGRITPDEAAWTAQIEPTAGRMLMNAITLDVPARRVAAGAHDQTIHIFDLVDGSLAGEIAVNLAEGPINSIRISSHPGHENELFVGCYSGAIVRVSPEGRVLGKLHLHNNAVKALRLHPHAPCGVSCSADGVLVSWDLEGNQLQEFRGHMAIIDDVDIDPTGKYVCSAGRDFSLKVYGLIDGKLLHTVSLGRRSPKALVFFDEHTVVVTNYWGELIRVALPGEKSLRKQIAANGISSIARCGDNLVAVSYDGGVYLVAPGDLTVLRSMHAMLQKVAEPACV